MALQCHLEFMHKCALAAFCGAKASTRIRGRRRPPTIALVKSGVALAKRQISGMANAIPAIPSPPPLQGQEVVIEKRGIMMLLLC